MGISTRSSAEYRNPRFVPLRELIAATGLDQKTVRNRLREGGVPMYADPSDSRRRLVLREEIGGLFDTPRRIDAPQTMSEGAA